MYAKQWIGHRVEDFDLRFLNQRFIVNKLNPGIDFCLEKRDGIFDTMLMSVVTKLRTTKLTELCQALEKYRSNPMVWMEVKYGKQL